MRLDRIRRTALSVAVLSVVGAIASSTGAGPSTDFALGSGPALSGADTSASGPSGATSVSGPSGATGASGDTGASGATGASGVSGPTGASGATGDSGPTGDSSATGPTGSSAPGSPTGDTSTATPPPTSTTATGTTSATGTTGDATTPVAAWGGTGSVGSAPAVNPNHGHHNHHQPSSTGGGSVVVPLITGSGAQPQSGTGPATAGGSGAGVKLGASAPSPALFDGFSPLAGVLPGSWQDPFIVPGGTVVPQYLIDIYHVPPFLLPVYQSAGTGYGVPWQVLAAINEVETDYGTNLDTSSAGAVGWMQFLPSTWKRYGVDASSSGSRDPYNAADAIFAAARYLAAAGAAHNLPGAIWAYNHSWSYVRSVLLRAQLLSGEPSSMISALSELAEGDFPIQLSYHASYGAQTTGAGSVAPAAHQTGAAPSPGAIGALAAGKVRRDAHTAIYANSDAAVVAVQDGVVVKIGRSAKLGRYVKVRNAFGDTFTYGHLSSVSRWYPTPKSQAAIQSSRPAALAAGPRPHGAASAGRQTGKHPRGALFAANGRPAHHTLTVAPPAPAGPLPVTLDLRSKVASSGIFTPIRVVDRALTRASSHSSTHAVTHTLHRPSLLRYFTAALGLRPSKVILEPLRTGSHVLAGTILGRLGQARGAHRPALLFELRPAGTRYAIDARPFLDSWSQLATVALHRVAYGAQLFGADDHPAGAGALLVASQLDLARTVLLDRRVSVPGCERAAIGSGSVDRRVLATLELLAAHRAHPSVSGAWCVNSRSAAATDPVLRTGNAVAIQAHATPATIGAEAARFARDVHALSGAHVAANAARDLIVISFAPAHQPLALAAAASFTGNIVLSPARGSALDARLLGIEQPRLPTAVSAAALKDAGSKHAH